MTRADIGTVLFAVGIGWALAIVVTLAFIG